MADGASLHRSVVKRFRKRSLTGNLDCLKCDYLGEVGSERIRKRNRETDAELVRAARAGYKTAFPTLFSRHQTRLLVICRRVLADPILAEDAAQEAALQALLGLDRLYRAERFGSWLVGIGLNVCRRWLRDRWRSPSSAEVFLGGQATGELLHPDPGPDEIAEERELAEVVRTAVDDLPAGQRSAVLLFYLAGLTHSETPSLLGIEAGAVKTRLHKARAALRRQLQSLWKEDRMTGEIESQLVEVTVADVRRRRAEGGRPAHCMLLLKEVGGDRGLPIWIGPAEGTAISLMLEKVEVPRPLQSQPRYDASGVDYHRPCAYGHGRVARHPHGNQAGV